VRPAGTPRVSPVEPLLLDGELWLSMMWQSRKVSDLLVDNPDPRPQHRHRPDGDEGEIKLWGRSVPVDDPQRRLRYRDAVEGLGWRPVEPHFHLFVVDIADVTSIRYAPNGDQHVARWPARVEFVRRATSPTSVGQPVSSRVRRIGSERERSKDVDDDRDSIDRRAGVISDETDLHKPQRASTPARTPGGSHKTQLLPRRGQTRQQRRTPRDSRPRVTLPAARLEPVPHGEGVVATRPGPRNVGSVMVIRPVGALP
jgi:hypothetical protein